MADTDTSTLFRLRSLPVSELPPLPSTTPTAPNSTSTTTPPDLTTFLTRVLADGHAFATRDIARDFKLSAAAKPSPPSTAPVRLMTHTVRASSLPSGDRGGYRDEAWFARESVHANAARAGTASWAEFDAGLRADHSANERDYTPGVLEAHEVGNWDAVLGGGSGQGADAQLQQPVGEIGGWSGVRACVMEMRHRIPPPLDDRYFPVLVVTAKREGEFIVVQIPVESWELPGGKFHKVGKVTAGMYVSVELCSLIDEGARVKWQMATASDAQGNLPMFVQKLGVPGAVVKDVGLFIDWCEKNRNK